MRAAFNWQWFTTGLDNTSERVRPTFRKFLQAARRIIGDESEEDFADFALVLYEGLTANDLELRARKAAVEKQLGTVRDDLFMEAATLAGHLATWRQRHVMATSPPATLAPGSAEEYGSAVTFAACFPDSLGAPAVPVSPPSAPLLVAPASEPLVEPRPAPDEEYAMPEGPTPEWLIETCASIASTTGADPSVLFDGVTAALASSKSDDALSADLFDLLGAPGAAAIAPMIASRRELALLAEPRAPSPTRARSRSPPPRAPPPGAQVRISRASDKQRLREERRMQRKAARQQGDAATSKEFVITPHWREKREEQLRTPRADLPPDNWRDLGPSGLNTDGPAGQMTSIPQGAVFHKHPGYEEAVIPPHAPEPLQPGERFIPIAELDAWAQPCFAGFESLNRIQSQIFEAAYHTNENLLVSAPTGAGKTNVALLTILHELGQHLVGGGGPIDASAAKVVYITPMKALAVEVVRGLTKRLASLSIVVRELTGDTQLSQAELKRTHVIVATPEKWDVVTRKSTDVGLTRQVKLLILDEVHLLHDERGPVLEALVARTLRQVEAMQSMIRIVGLSATIPNYQDIAQFLRVGKNGLFHFPSSYRPVPLQQHYIGIKANRSPGAQREQMNRVCFDRVVGTLREQQQVLVFVHSRADTGRTGEFLAEQGAAKCPDLFRMGSGEDGRNITQILRELERSKNRYVRELHRSGIGIHHAGMFRADRLFMERLFREGVIRVLVCTATLAWGVNLPAHAVVIKGTQWYNAKLGRFDDLSILDVMQIFGRAGRPQYDVQGEAAIITTHDKLRYYLSLLTAALPIESRLIESLEGNLNAEVVLGTVSNVAEACEWLGYTYLYVRMRSNPLGYGISWDQLASDPLLMEHRHQLVTAAAKVLANHKMSRHHPITQTLDTTDMGRVASHFYVHHDSIATFNELLRAQMDEKEIFHAVSMSHEFEQLAVREDECDELTQLRDRFCEVEVTAPVASAHGKANILAQAYIAQAPITGSALVYDLNYVAQNIGRIFRALFEIALRAGWCHLARRMHTLGLCVEHRMWWWSHPLRQFPTLPRDIAGKLEAKDLDIDTLLDMSAPDIGVYLRARRDGQMVLSAARQLPAMDIQCTVMPITHTILKMEVVLTAEFEWSDRVHGSAQPWWIWVGDTNGEEIYHFDSFALQRKNYTEPRTLSFTVPIHHDPMPDQYVIHVLSDRWLGAVYTEAVSFTHLIMPEEHPPHTDLLDLRPLPVTVLGKPPVEALYSFTHFNPIQTQVFHVAYHTDNNMLLGAPTGSGKTVVAELALMRLFDQHPTQKAVYIGPLKALVRERVEDWGKKFCPAVGRKIVELTGDSAPDQRALRAADILVTTPEKWDGISRNWQNRAYVQHVGLLIIDEIHMLGQDRGPILEAIVSRLRYISSRTEQPIRVVGLSTALANATDLADWLGIGDAGLFNFRPAVRPVSTTVHVQGFTGRHYCPRMQTMNRPTYNAIRNHAASKPALVFVSSRRQTRLTAQALVSCAAADEQPRCFLYMEENELEQAQHAIRDSNLRDLLSFGIGIHHAGLNKHDKAVVEDLFARQKIQVLVSTSTLAWGINMPARLVVVKGTEFYDAPTRRYVQYPITDILQMIGRAGRPQYDTEGVAVVMCVQSQLDFYKKFLYAPFPVESALHKHLHAHLNAEIASGAVQTASDALAYLTWTYFYRRLLVNPSYYGLQETGPEKVNEFLSYFVSGTLSDLAANMAIAVEGETVESLPLGRIASFYYLDYRTAFLFASRLGECQCDVPAVLKLLTDAFEFAELPVRHNEDQLNQQLAEQVPWAVNMATLDSPHTKALLLLQAHFSHLAMPCSDYVTDLKTVLDNAPRILQAMVDISAEQGYLDAALHAVLLLQMIVQARWHSDSTLMIVPGIDAPAVLRLAEQGIRYLPQLLHYTRDRQRELLQEARVADTQAALRALHSLPVLRPTVQLRRAPAAEGEGEGEGAEGSSEGEAAACPREVPEVGEEAELVLSLKRRTKGPRHVVTARFPKPIFETWFAAVGVPSTGELLALRRVSFAGSLETQATLTFPRPSAATRLYLVCDAYAGLDQEVDLAWDP